MFTLLFFIPLSYSQDVQSFDGYILDTVFRPSVEDSTVMDTVIIARKKVVVKKEVVVEKEVYVDPIFDESQIGFFTGAVFTKNETFSEESSPFFSASEAPGFEAGLQYRTILWKSISLAVSASYVLQKQSASLYYYQTTESIKHDTVRTLLDSYFMNINGKEEEIFEYEITPYSEIIYQADSSKIENSITYKSLAFKADIGVPIQAKKLTIYPQVSLGLSRQMSFAVSSSDSTFLKPVNTSTIYYGVSVSFSRSIYSKIDMFLTPSILFPSHTKIDSTDKHSILYGTRIGISYQFQ